MLAGGAATFDVMDQSGHRRVETLREYNDQPGQGVLHAVRSAFGEEVVVTVSFMRKRDGLESRLDTLSAALQSRGWLDAEYPRDSGEHEVLALNTFVRWPSLAS